MKFCMNQIVLFRRILLIFLVLAVILPISSTILFVVGGVFTSFGETGMATFFSRAGLAVGVLWGMDLIFLVIWTALDRFLTREGA